MGRLRVSTLPIRLRKSWRSRWPPNFWRSRTPATGRACVKTPPSLDCRNAT